VPFPSNPFEQTRLLEKHRSVQTIGLHHFAYPHMVAKGLDIANCAARCLGTGHGHKARSAHSQIVDALRAIALQRKAAWLSP
jgi:hypothetical protein